MNKTLFALTLVCITGFHSLAQQNINLKDVSKHVGDSVTVCGKIFSGKFLDKSTNQPTFLNMGAEYPNQILTIVIWGSARKLFPYKPEEKLKNKNVCITGKIEIFKNKPEIIVHSVSQVKEE
jgi:hypothetical protein